MINSDSVVTAYDEHLTLVEWLQKVEVLLKNGGLKETTLNDKGNATFSLTLTFNDGTKLESNAMTLTSVNTALRNLSLDLNTATQRIDVLEDEIGSGGGAGIIDISNTWSAITPTDFQSLKFKSYLVGNMIYIEIKAIFINRPESSKAIFQNTTYIIPEDVTLPFFDGSNVKSILGNNNKKLYVSNPMDSYRFYLTGWFTIEA
jgi:hypothetical protein